MAMTVLSAKLPPRELAIAAYHAKMTDASRTEIVHYSILRLAGYDHETAKKLATSRRSNIEFAEDERRVSVRIPEEWVAAAKSRNPGLNAATLFRYSLTVLTSNESEAMQLATRKKGPQTRQNEGETA